MPPRNGENSPDFVSYRTNCPRKVRPTTNSCLPSLLGSGVSNVSGLKVSWEGFVSEPKKPAFRGKAQICPRAPKTKYFPSAVHLPQHCRSLGLFQAGSKRCKPVPSTETSQSVLVPRTLSQAANRKSALSGDQTGLSIRA